VGVVAQVERLGPTAWYPEPVEPFLDEQQLVSVGLLQETPWNHFERNGSVERERVENEKETISLLLGLDGSSRIGHGVLSFIPKVFATEPFSGFR
jgi:hypothetical protein